MSEHLTHMDTWESDHENTLWFVSFWNRTQHPWTCSYNLYRHMRDWVCKISSNSCEWCRTKKNLSCFKSIYIARLTWHAIIYIHKVNNKGSPNFFWRNIKVLLITPQESNFEGLVKVALAYFLFCLPNVTMIYNYCSVGQWVQLYQNRLCRVLFIIYY